MIDISAQTDELCRLFELDPSHVAEMVLRPSSARVVVYRLNDEGRKFIEVPGSGEAATETREFEVVT